MKGNFFLGNGQFEVREMNLPEPQAHHVLIRNKAAGVCGTDVHIYHGEKERRHGSTPQENSAGSRGYRH